MADLTLKAKGVDDGGSQVMKDVASAVTKLNENLDKLNKTTKEGSDETAKATVKWQEMANAAKVAAKFIYEQGVAAVHASEEQAKADRALEQAAGSLADSFKDQATALQESLGVSDDMVETMQAMLLTYGVAPDAIDETVRALLDYSARTGTDAVAATKHLITSVDGGKVAFKELGGEFVATGSKAKDMEQQVRNITAAIGGTAAEDASTFTGSVNKAKQAFGELQETFGAFVTKTANQLGLVDKFTEAMRGLNTALGGDAQIERYNERNALLEEQQLLLKAGPPTMAEIEMGAVSYNEILDRQYAIKKRLIELDKEGQGPMGPERPDDWKDGKTGKELRSNVEEAKAHAKEMKKVLLENEKDAHQNFEDVRAMEDAAEQKRLEEEADRAMQTIDFFKEKNAAEKKLLDDEVRHAGAAWNQLEEDYDKHLKQQEDAFKRQQAQWAQAGKSIGDAFVGALDSALNKLASGEELDAGETVGDILATILQAALPVVGNLLLPGAGGVAGGLAGSLASAGIKAATRRKRHDGGWAGDMPRYHDGAWVGTDEEAAVLQHGERVLSRPEVAAMGGAAGVDAAARGDGTAGMIINVTTLDGSSAREYFEQAGGRALRDAVFTGRGMPQFLFGGG